VVSVHSMQSWYGSSFTSGCTLMGTTYDEDSDPVNASLLREGLVPSCFSSVSGQYVLQRTLSPE